jgi:hypothetical protein
MTRLLLFVAFGCFVLVVLTHVAERLQVLRGMGWGLLHSPGHYLDLFSAVAGVALLATGIVRWLLQSK